jgi:hypothetical protein
MAICKRCGESVFHMLGRWWSLSVDNRYRSTCEADNEPHEPEV